MMGVTLEIINTPVLGKELLEIVLNSIFLGISSGRRTSSAETLLTNIFQVT
jgi:hypothetical protein